MNAKIINKSLYFSDVENLCPMEVNEMPTLHLMVGLPCSGKTTYAKQLAFKEKALLLTPDVWQMKLFGQDFPGEYHDKRHENIVKSCGK